MLRLGAKNFERIFGSHSRIGSPADRDREWYILIREDPIRHWDTSMLLNTRWTFELSVDVASDDSLIQSLNWIQVHTYDLRLTKIIRAWRLDGGHNMVTYMISCEAERCICICIHSIHGMHDRWGLLIQRGIQTFFGIKIDYSLSIFGLTPIHVWCLFGWLIIRSRRFVETGMVLSSLLIIPA